MAENNKEKEDKNIEELKDSTEVNTNKTDENKKSTKISDKALKAKVEAICLTVFIILVFVIVAILSLVRGNNNNRDAVSDTEIQINGDEYIDSTEVQQDITAQRELEFAMSSEEDYSTVQAVVNSERLVGEIYPTYEITYELTKNNDGDLVYRHHYKADDFVGSGTFSKFNVDISYGQSGKLPVETSISIACINDYQAYTQLLASLAGTLGEMYNNEEMVSSLALGNQQVTFKVDDTEFTASETTTEYGEGFLLNYFIRANDYKDLAYSSKNLSKSDNKEDISIKTMFKTLSYEYTDDKFKDTMKDIVDTKSDMSINSIVIKKTYEYTDTMLKISFDDNAMIDATTREYSNSDSDKIYSININKVDLSKKDGLKIAKRAARELFGYEIEDSMFIEDSSTNNIPTLNYDNIIIRTADNAVTFTSAYSVFDNGAYAIIDDTNTEIDTSMDTMENNSDIMSDEEIQNQINSLEGSENIETTETEKVETTETEAVETTETEAVETTEAKTNN